MKVSPLIYLLISILTIGIAVVSTIYVKDTYFNNSEEVCDTQTQDEETTTTQLPAEVKKGVFKVEFTYPSEFIPGVRLCLTDVNDKSEIYCYFQKGTYDANTYANEYVPEDGLELPVGQYNLDFAEYDIEQGYIYPMFRLNECTQAANGTTQRSIVEEKCEGYFTSPYSDEGMDYMASLEEYGGDSIVIDITEANTTDIGKISVLPYLSK